MAHWKTEQYAEHLKKSYQSFKINCTFDDCPRFNNGCNVVPSQGILFGNTKAKLFFVTDLTSQDESDLRMPAIQPAGRLLREAMISHVLVQKKLPFLITKLFRSYIGEGKQPKVFESKLCFSHFHKELKSHQPELLVSLGMNVFNTLYNFAINKSDLPPKDEHTITKLRGKFFDFIFEDNIKVKVVITHSPGFVMQTPVLYKLFKEDAQVVANYCSTGSESIEKTSFEIKRIDRLETVKDIFDYLDFLHRGLPKPTVVAFDTETINLNRRFNNRFLTWQFSHEEGVGVSFPILHKDKALFADPKLRQELIVRTNALFNSTSKETKINWFVGHNIKFDLSVLWGLMGILPKDPRVNVPWWCTMLAAHWLDENRKGLRGFLSGSPFSLKTFGVEYFNFYFEEEALERRGDGALEELTLDQLYTYGGSDAALTRAIAYHQINVLAKAEPDDGANKLKKFAKNYYFPASRALAVLECNGIYVRQDHLAYLQGEDSPVWARMNTIEHKMQNLPDVLAFRDQYKDRIGGKIKNASNFEQDLWNFEDTSLPKLDLNKQDVQKYYYLDFLKLNPLKRSKKTGEPTLNSMFLNFYAKPTVFKETPTIKEKFCEYYGNPIGADEKDGTPLYNENALQLEAEYRKLKKLGTAYLDGIEGYLRNPKGDCIDSRVRASYNAHGTDTGRLSSQNPNLQQLPGRDKVAKSVKNMFQAEPPSEKFPEGTVLIQGDYKTAEVRWAALFSQDKNLISIFQESSRLIGEAISDASVTDQDFEKANLLADLHRRTASLMFGKPADQIGKNERQSSKCLIGDTLIYTNKGIIPIASLVKDQDDNNWLQKIDDVKVTSKCGATEIICVNHKWVEQTVELETGIGSIIEGDKDHPLIVWDKCELKEKTLDEINEGDFLIIPRSNDLWSDDSPTINYSLAAYPNKMSPELARILGYIIAEGDGQKFTMSGNVTKSAEMLADFQACIKVCFGLDLKVSEYPYTTTGIIRIPKKIRDYLMEVGLKKAYSETQSVPDIIFKSRKEEVINFLKAYFEGDGTVKSNSIVVMSASEKLMRQVQQLLLNFNIVSVLFSEFRLTPKGKEKRLYHGLRLCIRDTIEFGKVIGFISTKKQNKLKSLKLKFGGDKIYGLEQLLFDLRKKYKNCPNSNYFNINGTPVKFGERVKTGGVGEMTHELLDKRPYVLDALKVLSKENGSNVFDDISWLHETKAFITEIKRKSYKNNKTKVYDIQVADETHSFVANGVLSKNCITFGLMFGMAVKTLAENNGWTLEEGEDKLEKYFSAFPQLESWLKKIPDTAKRKGYVETFMGRRRRLKHLLEMGKLADSWKHLTEGERKAMNASIQGQSSDAGTIGMFTFLQYIFDHGLEESWLVENVVHDSCLVQVPYNDLKKALNVMKKCFVKDMQTYIEKNWDCEISVDIEMEFEIGLTYGGLTPWDGREKTLDTIVDKLNAEKVEIWKKTEAPAKPPKALDLVKYFG